MPDLERNTMSDKKPMNPVVKKKIFGWLKFIIGVALLYGAGILAFNYIPFLSKIQHYVIATGSMEPIISVGDLVLIDDSVSKDDLNIGDIIAFRVVVNAAGTEVVVVHYIADIEYDNDGERTFLTKPHISEDLDDWVLSDDDIVGRDRKSVV